LLLYLIRHGQTDWNREHRVMGRDPVPLNEQGRETVRRLAGTLEGEGIHFIYSSTVRRAMETSLILAEAWNSEVIEEPRLDESPYERWIGKRFGELESDPDFQRYMRKPSESNFSDTEGMIDLQRRGVAAIERILNERRAEQVAAVSHSDVIKPIIAHYLEMNLDAMHCLGIANASATLIRFRDAMPPRISFVNFAPWKW
jgi:broad specificity phosphatase PhoE